MKKLLFFALLIVGFAARLVHPNALHDAIEAGDANRVRELIRQNRGGY